MGGAITVADADIEHPVGPEDHPPAIGAQGAFPGIGNKDFSHVVQAALLKSGAVCVAYETVTSTGGRLPLLAPMSEVAGRMAVQAGSVYLEKSHGGMGVLLDGMPGVPSGHVVVLGAGVAGTQALKMAVMLGARVTVLDKNVNRLRQLDLVFGKRISSRFASKQNIENAVLDAELVIGSVLVPGASAPKLVSADLVSRMKNGAVVVDVAIDQGGCFETSRPTTHDQPTYEVGGVVHYCVPNMPGTVARTSTFALNSATLPHAVALADKGWQQALKEDRHLRNGLNLAQGHVTYPAVAQALGSSGRVAQGPKECFHIIRKIMGAMTV